MLGKTKSEILGIFFTNPEKSYYIGELGRILNKKPGVFQHTLNRLVKDNILYSEYQGNQRYFKLNKNYIFFDELKNIIYKTTGIFGILKKEFLKIKNINFVFIYGSFAKGKQNLYSDVDLFIVGKADENKIISMIDKIEKKFNREINYKILNLDELKKHIDKKNPFILNILNEKKFFIIGDEDEFRKNVERKSYKKTKT
jgi:predicted nucleotidyltransferase